MVNLHMPLSLIKNNGVKYLKYNIISTLMFGVLYWLSDYILTNYRKLSKELHFGEYKDHNPVDPFYYWLWQSLITQTTVGYGGITSATGKSISLLNFDNNLFKIFNFAQLFSIFYIAATLM